MEWNYIKRELLSVSERRRDRQQKKKDYNKKARASDRELLNLMSQVLLNGFRLQRQHCTAAAIGHLSPVQHSTSPTLNAN